MDQLNRKTWRDEPILAAMALIAVFFLTMLVGVSILVGATNTAPRPAALIVLLPAILVGMLAARTKATRRFFSRWHVQ